MKACLGKNFLKLGERTALVTDARSKPYNNNNATKPLKKEHKTMLTIGGEVTWQRDGETGEWKIRPAEENHHAKPNDVERLDQSVMESYLVPVLNLKTESVTLEV